MLTIFKKLFGKAPPKKDNALAAVEPPPIPQAQYESAIQMNKVEVAKLSLPAIVARLPEDLRALILKEPAPSATVVLPIQTIVKQLANGVVRMSLASLHRQAPAGMFKPLPTGDKRMVEVPLAEVFKHVKPKSFKRRTDQRSVETPPEDLAVFNSRNAPPPSTPNAAQKPKPAEVLEIDPTADMAPLEQPEAAPSAMRIVAPPTDFKQSAAKREPQKPAIAKATPAPAPESKPAEVVAPTAPVAPGTALVLPVNTVSAKWPEAIVAELKDLDPQTTVSLPTSELNGGMARGKIAFTWGQIRAWLTPAIAGTSAVDPTTEIVLPLKVIAPAFLAQTKRPTTGRKSALVDESIPALFNARKSEPEPVAPLAPATPEAPEAAVVEAPAAEAPLALAPVIEAPAETPAEEAALPEPASDPVAEAPVSETPAAPPKSAVGAAFGEPDKDSWTPAELIARVVGLPGVAGAVVALQEGFQVAHQLPDGVNAETISAFLPQIFGRLNQYAGEMKLGEVDDLLFTTRGAHCLIYRLGTVYFAVLGKPGASLPWNELRLVAAELSRQVQK